MTDELYEQIKLFLPKYLTPAEQNELFTELSKFPENPSMYLPDGVLSDDLLQGDGWRGFVAINFRSLERKVVSGIVLSNSCDIDITNKRALPTSVLFAPLIPLARYEQLLLGTGKTPEQVAGVLSAVRRQHVTSILYLPSAPHGPSESLVLLDDIHNHPLNDFIETSRTQLFRLNQYGFYILLIKLSIHFSRFQEGVKRIVA